MSIIRQRKGKLIRAGFIGALIVLIPCIIIASYGLSFRQKSESKKNEEVINMEVSMYRLIKNLAKDEEIKSSDLEMVLVEKDSKLTNTISLEQIIGKRCKISLTFGTIMSNDLIYNGEKLKDDIRRHKFTFVKLTEKINKGDYVDIRIFFPNGADFVILTKKKVLDFSLYNIENNTENALWIHVSEEEILRLSSAIVDGYNQSGCYIYATEYVSENQESAISNYPVSEVVKKLIETDPNIILKATNVLESSLRGEVIIDSGDILSYVHNMDVYTNARINEKDAVNVNNIYEGNNNLINENYNNHLYDEIEYLD